MATLFVIPACLESFLKKDAGQASKTENLYACDFIDGFISKSLIQRKTTMQGSILAWRL
jgi:hypothetical protein